MLIVPISLLLVLAVFIPVSLCADHVYSYIPVLIVSIIHSAALVLAALTSLFLCLLCTFSYPSVACTHPLSLCYGFPQRYLLCYGFCPNPSVLCFDSCNLVFLCHPLYLVRAFSFSCALPIPCSAYPYMPVPVHRHYELCVPCAVGHNIMLYVYVHCVFHVL